MQIVLNRWHGEGGYRKMLKVALPLIFSTGAMMMLQFVDRMFLTWYSPEAVAASLPAGVVTFTIMSFFIGIGAYVGTFVAQYYGAGQHERIGPVVWQGMYVALAAGLLHIGLLYLAEPIFRFVGHEPLVQHYEVIYFQVICLAAGPQVASAVIAGFFSGRGETWPVMWVNVLGIVVNLILDYALIFGHWGFPEMGIKGAALATLFANCLNAVVFFVLISHTSLRQRYHTLSGWALNPSLLMRLLRFGTPNGVQFFLEHIGFSLFILLVGRLGTTALAATVVAYNINSLAIAPMFGCGVAVSVLVGQYIGRDRPDLAEKSVYSGFHVTFVYMALVASSYLLAPEIFIKPFAVQSNPAEFAPLKAMILDLLKIGAVYVIFETMNVVFSAGIKGAGDTRFVMNATIILSILILVVTTYVFLIVFNRGIIAAWSIAAAFAVSMGLVFFVRFRRGKWKTMRVIETRPVEA